jgi:hypothetical protein
MDVDVEELWTRTVANRPTINPAIGFERIAPSPNTWPSILPNQKNKWNFSSYEKLLHLQQVEKPNSLYPMNRQINITNPVNRLF